MEYRNYSKPEVRRIAVPIDALIDVIQEVLCTGKTFCITITGNSMTPFLHHLRDQAVFAPLDNRTIQKGDIVFYQRDSGQFVMHRVYSVDQTGVMTIVGDAQWTLESGIRPDQLRAYVTQIVRKGKTISCEKGRWRTFMTIYMDMRIKSPMLTRFFLRVMTYGRKLLTDPACVIRYIRRKSGKG